MKNKNFIQSYFLLDKVTITEEYTEMLNKLKKDYLLEFDLIKEINGRELYYAVCRDETKIEDKQIEDDEGNLITQHGLLTIMSDRNPLILGVWNMDGTPLGQTKSIIPAVYDEQGEVVIKEQINYIGLPTYEFNKSKYLPYMDDICTYDDEGNELTRVRPVTPIPIRLFGGFKPPKFD
jgi:hypothetical protein